MSQQHKNDNWEEINLKKKMNNWILKK